MGGLHRYTDLQQWGTADPKQRQAEAAAGYPMCCYRKGFADVRGPQMRSGVLHPGRMKWICAARSISGRARTVTQREQRRGL